MKKILLGLVIALCSSLAVAHITAEQEGTLNLNGAVSNQRLKLGTLLTRTPNLLVAKYSYAVQGGSTVADISLLTDLGDKKSYATLPDNATITNAWIETLTAPTSSTSSTITLTANSSGDLKSAAGKALFIAGNYLQGVPTGATTTFIKLSADRTVKARIGPLTGGTDPLTAGKFNVYIEYVLGD